MESPSSTIWFMTGFSCAARESETSKSVPATPPAINRHLSSPSSMVSELTKESRDGGDEPTIGRLENDGCGRPLAERGIDAPGMEDERDAAVEELPADECAVGIAEIEIQYTRRDVRVRGQTQRLVKASSGQHLGACSLQVPRDVE